MIPNQRLVYSWKGGHESNVGYGAPLYSIVTFTLTPAANGTRLRLIHPGFVFPKNEGAFTAMGGGWKKVVAQIGILTGEQQ